MHFSPLHIQLFMLLTLSLSLPAQNTDKQLYRQIKSYFRDINQPIAEGDRKIEFLDADSLFEATGQRILQIMIVRHQKVNLPKSCCYTFREAGRYLAAYDTAGILPVKYRHIRLRPDEIDSVYTSNLLRSTATAEVLFGPGVPSSPSGFFREYKRNHPPIPLVCLPAGLWRFLATAGWMAGLDHQAVESYRMGRERAKQGARLLQSKAGNHGKVILTGHGFINYHIKKHLKKQGWKMVINGKGKNLGVTLFILIEP
jgi:hypothetical protein